MDMPQEMASDIRSSLGIVSELNLVNDENLEVTGLDEIDGEKAYAVTNKGGSSTSTSYFSVESGLKLKQVSVVEAMGQTQTQEQIFGEYKSFGGLQLPTVSSIPLGPQTIDVILSGVEINGNVVEGE
jgi:hypothetical protein